MAEEQGLSLESELDRILWVIEKIDKAQDLELISKHTKYALTIGLAPLGEKIIRQLVDKLKT